MRVIYVLWLRQLKRYWRTKSRIIGSLAQSVLFLVSLGFGMRATFAQAGQGDYFGFLAPGVIAQGVLFMAIFSGVELIWDRQFGFLKETLVAPVSRLKIIMGKTAGGATIAFFQGAIVFGLSLLMGFRPQSWGGVLGAFLIMLLTAIFYTSLGVAIACLMSDFHGFQLVMNFLVMPSFFMSGAFFPLASAPAVLQKIAFLNPLSYGVDGLRQFLTGQVYFGAGLDLLVLGGMSLVGVVLGSYLFSRVEV